MNEITRTNRTDTERVAAAPPTISIDDDATGEAVNAPELDFSTPPVSAKEPALLDIPGYILHEKLGEGGMGIVYRATQLPINRVVAVKMVLSPTRTDSRELIRFLFEAEAIASIDHPNVVRVIEFGDVEGCPFLVMEYLPHGTLAKKLRRGRLSPRAAAELVRKLAGAVEAAHERQIVHRDLKPGNVLFDAADEPRVTDFGLAKKAGSSDLTNSRAIMGTPAYMAPEQARGGSKFVGPPADVYALGVILFECLAGRRPFVNDDPMILLREVADKPAPSVKSFANVPADLVRVVEKCLAKEPNERYETAVMLAEDLRRFLAGEPVLARGAGAWERTSKWVKRNKLFAGITASVFFVLLATVGLLLQTVRAQKAEELQKSAEYKAEIDTARLEKQKLADAFLFEAQLALGQGLFREAVEKIDSVEAMGAELSFTSRLDRIQALESFAENYRVQEKLSAIDESALSGAERARSQLLWAQFLLGVDDAGAIRHAQAALDNPEAKIADREFAQGLLAKSAEEAHQHFAAAYALENAHLSARCNDMLTLISLGRFEETIDLGRRSQTLFAKDASIATYTALSLAICGRTSELELCFKIMRLQYGKEEMSAIEELLPLLEVFSAKNSSGSVGDLATMIKMTRLTSVIMKKFPRWLESIDSTLEKGPPSAVHIKLPPACRPVYQFMFLIFKKNLSSGLRGVAHPLEAIRLTEQELQELKRLTANHHEGFLCILYAEQLSIKLMNNQNDWIKMKPTPAQWDQYRDNAAIVAAAFEYAVAAKGHYINYRLLAIDAAASLYAAAGIGKYGTTERPEMQAKSRKYMLMRYHSEDWQKAPPNLVLYLLIAIATKEYQIASQMLKEYHPPRPDDPEYWGFQAQIDSALGNSISARHAIAKCRTLKMPADFDFAELEGKCNMAELQACKYQILEAMRILIGGAWIDKIQARLR